MPPGQVMIPEPAHEQPFEDHEVASISPRSTSGGATIIDDARPDSPSLVAQMLTTAAHHPDRPLLLTEDRVATALEIVERAGGLAERQQELGSEGPVGIAIDGAIDVLVGGLACLARGAPFFLCDPRLGTAGLERLLRSAAATTVIARSGGSVAHAAQTLGLTVIDPDQVPAAPLVTVPVGLDQVVLLGFSSGTTGEPTLHRRTRAAFEWHSFRDTDFADSRDARIGMLLGSSSGFVRRLIAQAALGVQKTCLDAHRTSYGTIVRTFTDHEITHLDLIPTVVRRVLGGMEVRNGDRGDCSMASVEVLESYGEPITWPEVERIRAAFDPGLTVRLGYGSSETGGRICDWTVDMAARGDELVVPVGWPRPGVTVQLLDSSGGPVDDGETGQVEAHHPYHREAVLLDDLARRLPDGRIALVGRADHQVTVMGSRVNLAALESTVRTGASIRDVAIVHRAGRARELEIHVSTVRTPQPDLRATVLRSVAALGPHLVESVRIVEHSGGFPTLPSGKVDRRSLEDRPH